MNAFSIAARYEINVQKSLAFLQSNNELTEKKIWKKTDKKQHITQRINLNKEVRDLYSESVRTVTEDTGGN